MLHVDSSEVGNFEYATMIPYSYRRRSSESRTEGECTDSTNISSTLFSRIGSDRSFNTERWGRILSRMKLLPVGRRLKSRRKPLSETRLREKLIKRAEKGDWDGVRSLISDFEFTDIPEPLLSGTRRRYNKRMTHHQALHRRPSYGSRSGDRLSFAGKESAAAAAAIKSALIDECSDVSSSTKPDIGENILHDMVRYNPPLDVIDTLLVSLQHRRGATCGTDAAGRTPLHIAASRGASSEVIESLIKADPGTASLGDINGMSPLHIAVRCLAYGNDDSLREDNRFPSRRGNGRDGPSEEEEFGRSFETIVILKEAMVNHPGKVDFKDEDFTGFAPVDYALDGDISDEFLLKCLLRRTLFKKRRSSVASADTQLTSNLVRGAQCHDSGMSSVSSDVQDIALLLRLEDDEIQERLARIEKKSTARHKKKEIKDVLFDVFGINEIANPLSLEEESVSVTIPRSKRRSSKISSSRSSCCRSLTESAIYNRHLEAYLNDFAGEDGLDYYNEDDDFDIHHDPELDHFEPQQLDVPPPIDPCNLPIIDVYIDIDGADDDNMSQCSYARSLVSEVTAPSMQ